MMFLLARSVYKRLSIFVHLEVVEKLQNQIAEDRNGEYHLRFDYRLRVPTVSATKAKAFASGS